VFRHTRKRDPFGKFGRTTDAMSIVLTQPGWRIVIDRLSGRDGHPATAGRRMRDQVTERTVTDVNGDRDSTPAQGPTDEELLTRHLEGDRTALPTLIARYSDDLIHFLTRFLGSRASAEDVFQETFLQIHQSAESFDTSRRFKPWLFTIAANKARDAHRKRARRRTVSLSSAVSEDGDGHAFVDLMDAELPTPDRPVLDAERSERVTLVIDGLPPHLREILLLSYFQKMSYNQIAEALEIPLGTVKSRLHSAVASFGRAWSSASSDSSTSEESRGSS